MSDPTQTMSTRPRAKRPRSPYQLRRRRPHLPHRSNPRRRLCQRPRDSPFSSSSKFRLASARQPTQFPRLAQSIWSPKRRARLGPPSRSFTLPLFKFLHNRYTPNTPANVLHVPCCSHEVKKKKKNDQLVLRLQSSRLCDLKAMAPHARLVCLDETRAVLLALFDHALVAFLLQES